MFYSNFVPLPCCTVFEIFDLQLYSALEAWVMGHSRSSEPTQIDPPPMTSYSCSIVIIGLSRTVSEINVISVENRKIFPPRVFCALADRVSLGIGYRRTESKTRMMGLLGRERSLTISSAVCVQYTNVTYRQRQTDRQTPADSKDGAYA